MLKVPGLESQVCRPKDINLPAFLSSVTAAAVPMPMPEPGLNFQESSVLGASVLSQCKDSHIALPPSSQEWTFILKLSSVKGT